MGNRLHKPKWARGSKKLREEGEEDDEGATATESPGPDTQGSDNGETSLNAEEGELNKSDKKKKKRIWKKSKKDKNKANKNTNSSEEEIVEEQGDKTKKTKKKKSKKDPKVKKEKKKKEQKDKKKGKKAKGAEKETSVPEGCIEAPSHETSTQDLTSDESKVDDTMRGKENTRPVSTYTPRPASPKGPGVTALMEKFSGGTPSGRPLSLAATGASSSSKTSHSFGRTSTYNRMDETPQKGGESNVSALKLKFLGNNAGSPATPSAPVTKTSPVKSPTSKTVVTPSKFKGVANTWQPKQYSQLRDSDSKSDSDVEQASSIQKTTTTTTTTTTTGIGALRNKFNNNAGDKAAEHKSLNPEKKRKIKETTNEKRADQAVQKENEKNRSPRKFWSPKKQPSATKTSTPSRDSSPNIDASSRKRKGNHLSKFGGKGKTKTEEKKELKESPVIRRTHQEQNGTESDEERREKARQLIVNRTSAIIGGISSLPKTPASTTTASTTITTSTPSRVQFEDMVPKRTKRDDSPKVRPKTEYDMQSTPTQRPRSMADTRQLFSSPLATTPGGTNIISKPKTNREKLLQWCQIHTQGYEGVNVTNFSSSWADGLAFCALVHKFHPTAFNYNSLSGSNRAHNFDLAFSSAQKYAKVTPLLETQDMLEMGDRPDWKCVFTYMTALYTGLNPHM